MTDTVCEATPTLKSRCQTLFKCLKIPSALKSLYKVKIYFLPKMILSTIKVLPIQEQSFMTFVPIKNYEGLYEVNPKGVVRSIDRILKVQGQATRLFKGCEFLLIVNFKPLYYYYIYIVLLCFF